MHEGRGGRLGEDRMLGEGERQLGQGRERRETLTHVYILQVIYRPEIDCLGSEMGNIIRGGPYRLPTSVNLLTKVFTLEKLP